MLLPVSPPKTLRALYPQCFWNLPNTENKIYLTFDDGPTPELLPFILETLDTYKIQATFFCVGENICKHPELFKQLLEKHVVGNHTFNHMSGWKNPNYTYYKNIKKFETIYNTPLFRPPYGRISRTQAKHISKQYKIIMWDVLSYDYRKTITPKKCLNNVVKHVKSGSVIVFHDNKKAKKNVTYALPRAIEQLSEKGFIFDTIKT
ncbi:MAG TPA: polysaccharide deacetylase family protein [Bacteroidia bacterium]|jgi:peptidoglycan/xylan/chitin deacetylase (PgdA/CDA1 family)|nr:polysaccharide deacetylase family protein [Bacteroidia bacterium]